MVKNIYVDIDETICRYIDERYYPHAIPVTDPRAV